MRSTHPIPRTLVVFIVAAGLAAALATWSGSLVAGVLAGVGTWLVAMASWWWAARSGIFGGTHDPARRRLLAFAGVGGLAWVAVGTGVGRLVAKLQRPDAAAVQEAAATDLGADYMELVRRAYHPGRSGDLQLLVAPFNSANYAAESMSLVPRDPRTSHAAVWMYLQRIPLVVYGPGIVEPSDHGDRVTLADLAPTTASLIGAEWPSGRDGRVLPGLRTTGKVPKVVVTFVIDGGGWNVLQAWPEAWPNLAKVMRGGANHRDAIVGSFPAVTASAHATIGTGAFPATHGITGHNIRDGASVRKAYRTIGRADTDDILVPTLADMWHDATGAWVGEVGYQVWHLGMLGRGGTARPAGDLPVGVYFDDAGGTGWKPHHPDRYRLPAVTPGLEVLAARQAAFADPGWDETFEPWRTTTCCVPPIAGYQGDLIEATIDSEPVGRGDATSLLFTTHKSPDYVGHVYGMGSRWEELMLRAVDDELGRLVVLLDERFPSDHVVIVTADHGQCPLPDAAGGVRLDPIQLERVLEEEFGAGLASVVQSVVPSEVYLDAGALRDAGASLDDVAAHLRRLTYRQNLGPYVPRDAVEQTLLDREEFAAVFATTWLDRLGDVTRFGATRYDGPDIDPGVPPASSIP